MLDAREAEIRRNFDYFQAVVGTMMADHAGEFALIHDAEVIRFYVTPTEAVTEGARLYGDVPFSVQCVIDRPIDLGFLSHATDNGVAV